MAAGVMQRDIHGVAGSREKNRRLTAEEIQEYCRLQEELHALRQQYHLPVEEEKPTLFARLGSAYYAFKEKHSTTRRVRRSTYLWLCLPGLFGVHQFYAGHRWRGMLYLAFCWTGIPAALSLIDWMAALPMQADEEGYIEI